MRRTLLARAIAGAFAFVGNAHAQQDEIVVTASPLGSGLFDLVAPAEVLDGGALARRRAGSLGETLQGLPGVSSTYFGPQASRPVIRGLDADRIRILQNGVGMLDASSLSFDHAVPYDPLVAERIEVVRGPAAVLYGGNAVGGVVNVMDNRIPDAPIHGLTGRAEPRLGGPDDERSLGAVLEGGNGRVSLHADGFGRKTGELRTPLGRLANSDGRADGGSLGGSLHWEGGYLGASYQGFASNYGSIPEPDVRIDMRSERWDVAGAAGGVKFKLGRTDYEHRELDLGEVATTFRNQGTDGRLEYAHGKLGPFDGALGVTFSESEFSALGEEAFVPSTNTDARGLFVYEEVPLQDWKLSAGVRSDRTRVTDFAQPRRFDTVSAAFGAVYSLNRQFALTGNLSSTERAPTFYELYANGPHAATGVFEVGNAGFEKEKSRSVDLGARWRSGPHSASVSAFRTRFENFITLVGTGAERTLPDGDVLPEFAYQALPALFRGVEAQGRWRVHEKQGTLEVELKGDYVRAEDRSSGTPLPRIAPARFGAALDYAVARYTARVDVVHAAAQNRVGPEETPTDDYTLVNLSFGYRFALPDTAALQAFLRITNLFDEVARNHTSFIKDIAPLGGRGALVGLRGSF